MAMVEEREKEKKKIGKFDRRTLHVLIINHRVQQLHRLLFIQKLDFPRRGGRRFLFLGILLRSLFCDICLFVCLPG